MRAVQQRHCGSSPLIMTMLSSPQVTLLHVLLPPATPSYCRAVHMSRAHGKWVSQTT